MLVKQGLQTQEVATGFRHLAGIDLQEIAMHPEVRQTRAVAGLILCNLIAVMDGDMIFTTAMDIKPRCQILG